MARFIKEPELFNFFVMFLHQHKEVKHYDGRKTFGHSLIISPDGQILKEIKNDKEGVITANINIKLPEKLRSVIPSLINN